MNRPLMSNIRPTNAGLDWTSNRDIYTRGIIVTEKQRQQLLEELLEKQKNGTLTAADRFEIPPQEMSSQDAAKRRSNVNEVATGYTETQARLEAMRCLRCKTQPCIKGCPVKIRIKDFITAVADGKFKGYGLG